MLKSHHSRKVYRIQVSLYLLCLAFFISLPHLAHGVQRFPPPEFKETGHELPITTVPKPRSNLQEYLDVVFLVAALALASYLVLKRRSRRGVLILGLFSLFYFGFWREGCVCSIGATQNIALGLSGNGYAVPLAVIAFFAFPLIFTLFFGRTFCAAVCPLGAIQDVVLIRPIKVPMWLERALRVFPYVYLGAAILFAATNSLFIICEYDPFISFFRRSGSLYMLLLGAFVLLIGMFVGRPYCRYICPYSVLLSWASRASKWHASITPNECIQCRLCEDSCPFNSIKKPNTDATNPKRTEGKRRLTIFIVLLPVLVALGTIIGVYTGSPMSRVNRTVSLAQSISTGQIEENGELSDEVDAFYRTGQPVDELYAEAEGIGRQFSIGGGILGGFLGLAIGAMLIGLSIRRKQVDYETDRVNCVSCARCFSYCPVGKEMNTDSKDKKLSEIGQN